MRRLIALAAIFGCTSVPAAHAADVRTVDCIITTAGPAIVGSIVDKVTTALMARDRNALNPDFLPLRPAAATCRTANKWTDPQLTLAAQVTMSNAILPALERALRKEGVDPAKVAAVYRASPVAARRSFLSKDTMLAGGQVIMPRLRAANVKLNPYAAYLAGALMGALSNIEFKTAEFAAS